MTVEYTNIFNAVAGMATDAQKIIDNAVLLDQNVVTLTEEARILADQKAGLLTEIDRLTLALKTCQEGNPQPPINKHKMPVGATVGRRGTETQAQAITRFERETGPLGIRRAFTGSSISSATLNAMLTLDAGKRNRHYSFKGSGAKALTPAILKLIPKDGFHTDLTVWHEVENDGGTHTPAWYKAEQKIWGDMILAEGRDDLHPNCVFMSWLERDASQATTTREWIPDGDLTKWHMGLDPYDDNSNKTLGSLIHNTVQIWIDEGGLLENVCISETGTKRTGADAAAWLNQSIDYALSQKFRNYCYFDSPEGTRGPWWLDDPALRAAYRARAPIATAA